MIRFDYLSAVRGIKYCLSFSPRSTGGLFMRPIKAKFKLLNCTICQGSHDIGDWIIRYKNGWASVKCVMSITPPSERSTILAPDKFDVKRPIRKPLSSSENQAREIVADMLKSDEEREF